MSTTTPPLLFLLILLFTSTTTSQPPPLNDEVLFLVAFKSSLLDPTSSLSSWSPSSPSPCSWPHIQCDNNARVSHLLLSSLSLSGTPLFRDISHFLPHLRILDLSNNSLSGPIPDNLPSLRSLDLSANSFSSPIPTSLFSNSFSSLRYLSLSDNQLTNTIPPALSQCRFLLHLNLSNNRLSGSPNFSNTIWPLSRLRVLDLSANSLSGPVSDNGIANLHNLKVLRLARNAFSGPVPVGIGLCPHLNVVDLHDNFFDGGIPYTFQSLNSLSVLDLSNNKLFGEVSSWIGNLSSLQMLDLSRNGFTGQIPESIGGLQNLNYLSVSYNRLSGRIPRGLFYVGVEVLDLSLNNLTGEIPPELGRLVQTIRVLNLASNLLKGEIPKEMLSYQNMQYLNLSWNGLRSQLPPELGMMKKLSVLDLRGNEMYGTIPEELCESGSLLVLQLDGNELDGNIPDEIGNCSSLYLLSLSHNELSGPIPSTMSYLKNLKILNLELNTLTGEIPPQLGTLDNLLAVNISHNRLVGRLPTGSIFPSLDKTSLQGNLGLCSPLVAEPCKMNVPKPLVFNPNAYINGDNDNMVAMPHDRPPFSYKHKKFLSVSTIIAISAALVIIFGVLVVTMLNLSARRRLRTVAESALESTCSSSSKSGGPAIGKTVLFGPRSSLRSEDLVSAESLLIKAVEIGRGALGTLYKSSIGEGRIVAIKKLLTPNIVQYHDEFDREIRVLAKARHPNLMAVKGYYWTPQLQLLISDFAPNGSLQSKLHEKSSLDSSPPFMWANRFKILQGIAKALAYLHHSMRPPVIHYNIKPSNILLDGEFNAKVSDFGLARLLPKFERHIMSSRFQTAMGYVAPELACSSLRVNEKCDVYAFGVVVLELVTGRRAVECGEDDVVVLVDLVRGKLEEGYAMDCVDGRMGEFPEEEVLPVMKLGMVCASQIPSSRPTMGEVVQILNVIKTPAAVEGMGQQQLF